jgi:hypothetical protein
MPRPKREPYNPNKPHDRRATAFSKGVANHVAPEEVDDPYEPGSTIIVMRQRRDDTLGNLKSRKHINDAQYEGGRAFQGDFETAERGPRAIDPSKEAVDGGLMPEPISEAQRKAVVRLNRAHRELGQEGSALVHDLVIRSWTYRQVAVARGLRGERWENYFGMRFHECLTCLAVVYGFSMREGKQQ